MTSIAVLVTLGLFLLALIIVLVAWVGPDRFVALWAALPLRVRSMVNVALAGVLAFGGSALIDWLSSSTIPTWVKVFVTAVLTPIIRQLNSADSYPNDGGNAVTAGAHEAPVDGTD